MILFPTRTPINAGCAVRKTIPFENGQLEVWIAQSRLARSKGNPEVYVLRFYGNADRAERWPVAEAEMWNDRAVEIWGTNYPGFGGSTGPARLSKIGPAALAAFDELKRHAIDRPIVPFGTSIGATATLHIAAQRPVVGVVLQNPPPLRESCVGLAGGTCGCWQVLSRYRFRKTSTASETRRRFALRQSSYSRKRMKSFFRTITSL